MSGIICHALNSDEILLIGGNEEVTGRTKNVYSFKPKSFGLTLDGQLGEEVYSGDSTLIENNNILYLMGDSDRIEAYDAVSRTSHSFQGFQYSIKHSFSFKA